MTRHYSPSQINQYLRCNAQWYFRYVEGLKKPPASALVQGSSFHDALDVNFSQKVETKKDLEIDVVQDAAAEAFEKRAPEIEWDSDEKSEGIEKVKGRMKDETVGLVTVYHKDLSPKINPIASEKEFILETDQDYSIKGVIDLIDMNGTIIDHKTTGRTPSEISADHALQGIIYCIANETSRYAFNYAVKNKTPKTVSLEAKAEMTDKEYVLEVVGRMDHAIKSGVFLPNRNSFMCSKRSCGFWQECESKYKGRVKD